MPLAKNDTSSPCLIKRENHWLGDFQRLPAKKAQTPHICQFLLRTTSESWSRGGPISPTGTLSNRDEANERAVHQIRPGRKKSVVLSENLPSLHPQTQPAWLCPQHPRVLDRAFLFSTAPQNKSSHGQWDPHQCATPNLRIMCAKTWTNWGPSG